MPRRKQRPTANFPVYRQEHPGNVASMLVQSRRRAHRQPYRSGHARLSLLLTVGMALHAVAAAAPPSTTKLPWAQRLTGYLTTTDGVKLQYSVLLPKSSGRFPVVINYSGYDPGAIGGLAYREGDSAMSPNLDRTLLEHGYAAMAVKARGTGCSQGEVDVLGPE